MARRLPAPPTLLTGVVLAILVGALLGTGVFTFGYARGASYLSNDPAACANCHVMQAHMDGWQHSSHRAVATCNDCHTPHNLVGKYLTKASNGFWHSFAFTSGRYPDPLRIKASNLEIAENACRDCHASVVSAMAPGVHQTGQGTARSAEPLPYCTRCHASAGHRVR